MEVMEDDQASLIFFLRDKLVSKSTKGFQGPLLAQRSSLHKSMSCFSFNFKFSLPSYQFQHPC